MESKTKRIQRAIGYLTNVRSKEVIEVLQNKTLNVTEIEFALSRNDVRLSQASVSGTLSRLKEFRFVKCKQDGKFVYYTLNPKTIDRLLTFAKEIA